MILEIIIAASLPKPLRITRRGFFLALLAVLAIPIAPSAAAKDSCPARKQKQSVSSLKQHCAQVTVAQANFALFRNRTRDTESLQADTDGFSSVSRFGDTFFQCHSNA